MKIFSIVLFFGIIAIASCEIVGAPEDVDPMDKTVQRMAKFAVGEIGSKYKLREVISGTKQLVSGILYNLEIVTKRKIKGQNVKERRCRVLVYKIKAEDYFELEEFHCYFNEKESTF